VAANLAVVTARAGQYTVLVDGNLRAPSLHRCFGLSNERGLSSVLFGQASLDEVLLPVPGVAGLSVLVAGPPPPNPWELLSAARFSRLLDELSKRGIVILDSPAALQNSDASALAMRADVTLLVANASISRRRELRQAVTMLERVETRMLGTVLVQVSTEEFDFGGEGTDPSPQVQPAGNGAGVIAKEPAEPVPTRLP
jgi:capsular exopolysaccharide synthesis family protein